MDKVEMSRTLRRKTYWREFNRNFIKQYFKFLGYSALIAFVMLVVIHLWVGASNQAHDKYNSIRDKNYTEMR